MLQYLNCEISNEFYPDRNHSYAIRTFRSVVYLHTSFYPGMSLHSTELQISGKCHGCVGKVAMQFFCIFVLGKICSLSFNSYMCVLFMFMNCSWLEFFFICIILFCLVIYQKGSAYPREGHFYRSCTDYG